MKLAWVSSRKAEPVRRPLISTEPSSEAAPKPVAGSRQPVSRRVSRKGSRCSISPLTGETGEYSCTSEDWTAASAAAASKPSGIGSQRS